MTDRGFVRIFAIMIGALLALAVLLAVLGNVIGGITDRALAADQRPQTEKLIAERIAPVGKLNIGSAPAEVPQAAAPEAKAASPGEATYNSTCIACHGAGIAGAPKFGDKDIWAPHIAKGMDTLDDHAIHGFTGNTGTMPAKGGNPSLGDDDVKAAVAYMVEHSK